MSSERRLVSLVCLALVGSSVGAALAGALAALLGVSPFVLGVCGVAAGAVIAVAVARDRLARQLPDELDGWFMRRPRLRVLWIVAVVVAISNTARIGVFMADPAQQWASAFPPVPESAQHQCLAAYVRAGELAATDHANLWRVADYTQQPTSLHGLQKYMGDPYEYPPAFAVLPRAAVAATGDYQVIRSLWFGISALGFWLAYLALAIWAGRRTGATALLLAPATAISFPLVMGLQWGQAHVLVVAAAVAGMVYFARGKTLVGGALLGAAIATKMFPGLLLVHLVARRQWRALGATLGFIAAFFALSAIVLGPATLTTFVSDHIPSMASGEAFSYTFTNPDNHSLYGLALKLGVLGLDVGRGLARVLSAGWLALALVLTIISSRRQSDREHDAVLWLGINALATLQSPFAPTYTAIGSLWLLALFTGLRPRLRPLVVACWILLQGAPPLGSPAMTVIASLPSQLVTIAIAIIGAWPRRERHG